MKSWYLRVSPFGVPLFLHVSAIIMLALIAMITGIVGALVVFPLVVVSIAAHEYAHVWAGQRCGIGFTCVEIFALGGIAKMGSDVYILNPRSEILTALAGPAASLALGLPLMVVAPENSLLALVAVFNVAVGVFNLLPAFPMDGGRVLRAILHTRFGFAAATSAAAITTYVLAAVAAVAGIVLIHSLWIAIIMAFICFGAYQENKQVQDGQLN